MEDVKRKIKEIKDKGILDLNKRNFFKKGALGLAGVGGLALLSKMPLVKPWELINTKLSKASIGTISGIIETDGTYIDCEVFGPAVDGYDWDERTAASTSKLMLATIKDAGDDTTVEIWDLTDPAVVGGTALGSVTLSGDATPTSIAASMGYIIVGSEDGISIVDPHGGSWAERTQGWPKSSSTSTVPDLPDNNVTSVSYVIADQAPLDPRTGGPLPDFIGTTNGIPFVMNASGTINERSISDSRVAATSARGAMIQARNAATKQIISSLKIERETATNSSTLGTGASIGTNVPTSVAFGIFQVNTTALNATNAMLARASSSGLEFFTNPNPADSTMSGMSNAQIDRTFNTGYVPLNNKGAWLANSATADRSNNSNTLTENGTVTEAAVESGAELKGYSGFSDSTNYLSRAYDADFDFGTGSYSAMIWFKRSGSTGYNALFKRDQSGGGGAKIFMQVQDGGEINNQVTDGTNEVNLSTTQTYNDNVWHMAVGTFDGETLKTYVDGVLVKEGTNASVGSLNNGTALLYVGAGTAGADACDETSIALFRLSATAPSAAQIRAMYEAEKGMFEANAKCLLQSSSTDAVLDVDVDKISGKVAVTQTDSVTIWDGLVVESEPTIATGGTTWEHTKLFGEKRVEINDANLFYTAPAEKLREVAEVVRGMGSKLPKGVDLGKAKAWLILNATVPSIISSYNIESITDTGTGRFSITLGVKFKGKVATLVAGGDNSGNVYGVYDATPVSNDHEIFFYNTSDTATDPERGSAVFFGELENE